MENREQGIPLIKQAVLFRASHNSDALEIELHRRNVPFVKWGGLKFLESGHIKDLLAFLRIMENPRDDLSWMRILQMIDGIGPGKARQAFDHLQAGAGKFDSLLTWKPPPAAEKEIGDLVKLLIETSGDDLPLSTQIERIRRFYTPIFEERYDQPEMRLRDLDQLELLAQRSPSRAVFLADLTLDPPQSTGDLCGPPLMDEEYVVLSTIHSAKGCEWDAVFLLHAADGVLPSDMSNSEADLEEERRLLYVAMTRARNHLHVIFPLRYYHKKHNFGDSYSTAQLSRFLPPTIHQHFERRAHAMPADEAASQTGTSAGVGEAVRSRLQRLWS
jgi:DNA helicase-2/ATP-dependent DNA helicase PcrA